MGKYCTNCGKELHAGARFCAKCGAAVLDAPVNPVPAAQPIAEAQPQKSTPPAVPPKRKSAAAPKRNGGRNVLCIVLSVLLVIQIVAVALYGWPGFMVDGVAEAKAKANGDVRLSTIRLSKKDYNVKPVVVNVGPEQPIAQADGITVDFNEFNLAADAELEIRDIGVKADQENELNAHCYDFSLGDIQQFNTFVTITLPFEKPSADAGSPFVQYYNESTGAWELIYAEIDEAAGTATFYTDHFSTFGLFTYENERFSGGPLAKVRFDPTALDRLLEGSEEDTKAFIKMLQKGSSADKVLIDRAFDILGTASNTVSSIDYGSSYTAAVVGKLLSNCDIAFAETFSNILGTVGIGLTSVKVGLTWYQSGSLTEAYHQNKSDIFETACGIAATWGGAPFVVLGGTIWLQGMTEESITAIYDGGYKDGRSHAYQEFTWNAVAYSPGDNCFTYRMPDRMLYRGYVDELADGVVMNDALWAMLLKRTYKRYKDDPLAMLQATNQMLEDYAAAFWKIKPNVRKRIAEGIHTTDQWVEPTETERQVLKDELISELRYRLKDQFGWLYQQSIIDAKSNLLNDIAKLTAQMNTISSYTVVALDENGKEVPLSKTMYKDYIAAFAVSPTDKPVQWSWYPGGEKGVFQCTLYAYLTMGAPACVKFYKTWEDQVADKTAFTLPLTYAPGDVKLFIGYDDEEEPSETLPAQKPPEESAAPPAASDGLSIKETIGYWKLVRSFENKYETSAADEYYTQTWSGGGGSYTYNCKFTGSHWYTGSTHDDCHGEFVNNTGTASTPKDTYMGGERVEIDLKITASTSSNICFHLGASMGASISYINDDDPFVGYDTSLYDVSEKITRSYIMTGKNDTNTGYWGESATVGGEMPSGSANGDKVYIVIGMGGGNNSVETAYEYEWVVK